MFSPAIERALRASIAAHEGQFQKGAVRIPYVVHPLHVALLLARWGAGEDEIVAGLLHDVVEDCPKEWSLGRAEEEYGPTVASIVGELTEDKSRTWEERKRAAVEHVPHLSPEAARVKAADVLHNLNRLREALRASEDPAALWGRFKGGRERTLAHYGEIVDALAGKTAPEISHSLRQALLGLNELT